MSRRLRDIKNFTPSQKKKCFQLVRAITPNDFLSPFLSVDKNKYALSSSGKTFLSPCFSFQIREMRIEKPSKHERQAYDYAMGFSEVALPLKRSENQPQEEEWKKSQRERMKRILKAYPVKQTNKCKLQCTHLGRKKWKAFFSMILITKEEW